MPATTQSELSLAYEALTKVRAFNSKGKPNHLEINARWRVFVGIVYQTLHADPIIREKTLDVAARNEACKKNNALWDATLQPIIEKHNKEAESIVNGREALRILRQDDFPSPSIGARTMEWAQTRVKKEADAVKDINARMMDLSHAFINAKQELENAIKEKLTSEGVDEEDIARLLPAFIK